MSSPRMETRIASYPHSMSFLALPEICKGRTGTRLFDNESVHNPPCGSDGLSVVVAWMKMLANLVSPTLYADPT